jgi:hypothetical protein
MQEGCKVYVDSCMASNGSCFMVTWTIFKKYLLEIGLTQNWETMAFQNTHNHWIIKITFGWGPGHIWIHIRALHWVSIPMPMGSWFEWAWVRCYWASVLCIPASSSKSESNFSDAGNTLTKRRSWLKPTTKNDLLLVRSNQDLVYVGNTHYITHFLNTRAQFE